MVLLKIYKALVITFITLFISASSFGQTPGVDWILIDFQTIPTTYNIEKTALKYNKDFSINMHMDDGGKDIYTHAYPLLNGGTIQGTNYPGLFYTDGAGNDIAFKMSTSHFSFNNDMTEDVHDPNGSYGSLMISWDEMIEMYQDGWGIYNHGINSSTNLDYTYSIRRNHSYTKRMMLSAVDGGPEMKIFVNPNGNEGYTTPAFNEGYYAAYRQYSFGVPSFDVTATIITDTLKMGRTELSGVESLSGMAATMAGLSTGGAHHWGSTFNHSVTGGQGYSWPIFKAHMETIASNYGKAGADNVWMTTEEEVRDYLHVNRDLVLSTQLIGSQLIISFSGTMPTDLRHYASTILITSDAIIDTIFIDGGGPHTFGAMGNDTLMINLNWDGFVAVPDTVNAETYVTIAEQSQSQNDWWVAMDYVEILDAGPTKEAYRDRLCAIQGVIPPDGYCDCTASAGNDTTICIGDCTVLTASVGESYYWSTGETTQSITVCPTYDSTYWVTVYNSVGCPADDTVTVFVSDYPTPSTSSDTTICNTNCIDISAYGGTWYVWSTGDTAQTITVCPEDTTNYYVMIYNDANCGVEDTVTVNTIIGPDVWAGNDTTVCLGDTAFLVATGGDSYLWNTGDTTASIQVAPNVTATYIVEATIGNGCSAEDTVLVNVQMPPVVTVSNDTTICANYCTEIWATGGGDYFWEPPEQTDDTITVCPSDTTTYFVTVMDDLGCSTVDSVTVNTLYNPAYNWPADTGICFGDTMYLTLPLADIYVWSTGDTTQTVAIYTDTDTTVWANTYHNNGCDWSDTITINQNPMPIAIASDDTTICFGGTAMLTGSGAYPGGTYLWEPGGYTADTIYVSPTDTTQYILTVTNGLNCSDSDTVDVNVKPSPIAVIEPNINVICQYSTQMFTVDLYDSILWNTGETNDTIYYSFDNAEVEEDIIVYVENEFECPSWDTVSVYVNPSPSLIYDPELLSCPGDTVTLGVKSEGSLLVYTWSTGQSGDTITVSPNDTTTYYCVGTNGHLCTDTAWITVNTLAPPEINLFTGTTICLNDTTILDAGGDYPFYLWSPDGQTTRAILASPEENTWYHVTVIDSDGCMNTDSTLVVVRDIPERPEIISFFPLFCEMDEAVLLEATPEGGVFDGPGVDPDLKTFDPVVAGPGYHHITYTVSDEYGCKNGDTTMASVVELPTAIIQTDTMVVCNTDIVFFSVLNNIFDSYLWPDGTTDPSVYLDMGEFQTGSDVPIWVIVTQGGCTNSDTLYIENQLCDGIDENANLLNVVFYPNPGTGDLNLKMNTREKRLDLEMINLNGDVIYQEHLINCNTPGYHRSFDFAMLPKGVYIIRLRNQNIIQHHRIILN